MFSRRVRKTIAAFFLVVIVNSVIAPSLSYALTSGPTAPEATSFEPVDTTDLVNMISGDLVYNTPIIEVPGPAGGYPLSLSYHAGIQPNEEASWVGLGFIINPGAITRNVNGYADDHNGVSNVDRAYWEGGNRETYNAGVSVGIANSPASVSFGLSFSQDTYQGFGVGSHVGFGLSPGISETIGVNAGMSINHGPYGGSDISAGMGVGLGNASLGVNLGESGVSGTMSMKFAMVGASISSNHTKPSLSVGGATAGVYNSKAGSISTTSSGFGIDVPVYPGISVSLGYNFQRYWSDETATVKTFGALHSPKAPVLNFDKNSYDSYRTLTPTVSIQENPNPDLSTSGSFPDYDNYSVTAQGLSGSIRPYAYKSLIFRQNRKKDGDYQIKQYAYHANDYRNESIEFRFVNDFSNKYLYDKGELVEGQIPLRANFDNSEKTGEYDNDGIYDNHLAGSKHIEWYTNQQILSIETTKNPAEDGFIECNSPGFNRSALPGHQIGGYMITNESGVSYHYALPVYSRAEYVYSENINQEDGQTYNSLKKPEKYAYEWLLTAVSGPDYVDRNENQRVDKDDWGYWVEFKYDKYSSDYAWRNPSEGFHMDLDNNFKNYSSGIKEVYYLSSIRTQSHVAVFEKSERLDGREVTNSATGGFAPKPISAGLVECVENCNSFCHNEDCSDPQYNTCLIACYNTNAYEITGYVYPESSMRLDKIKLYNADDIDLGRTDDQYTLRTIVFEYDYSLAPETPNSYNESMPIEKSGKLTLLSLSFLGKKGIGMIPPTSFSYGSQFIEDEALVNEITGSGIARVPFNSLDASSIQKLQRGVIIQFYQTEVLKYGVVTGQKGSHVYIYSLGSRAISTGAITDISTTKNPPYGKEKYDVWNMYKINGFFDEIGKDENGGRVVDLFSAQNVDAWSLRKITNSLGSSTEIEYESDDYSATALHQNYQFRLEIAGSVEDDPHVYLRLAAVTELDKIFKVGDMINILLVANYDDRCMEFLPRTPYLLTLPIAGFDLENNAIKVLSLALKQTLAKPDGCDRLGNNFLAGHIGTESPIFRQGGGIRVKNIKLISDSQTRITSYTYTDAAGNSSGSTSYEPFTLGSSIKKEVAYKWEHFYDGWHQGDSYDDYDYNRIFYKSFSKLLNIARELPAPGVMYKNVTVKESIVYPDGKVQEIPNYSTYDFEVFSPEQIDVVTLKPFEIISTDDGVYDGISYTDITTRDFAIKDYTSRIGNLKRVTLYKTPGNTKISETVYNYLHDPDENAPPEYADRMAAYRNQGVIQETFIDAKFLYENNLRGVVTRKHQYPSIKTGETNINYITGIKTETKNLAFDFYSGAVSEQLSLDSYGNRYLTKSTAAYHYYPQMNSKIYSASNRNMLTQNAATYTFKIDNANAREGLVNASIQTWSDATPVLDVSSGQPGIWRRSSAFQWNGSLPLPDDGLYPQEDFDNNQFNWSPLATNPSWERTGEITLYDFFSHSLEAKDINGNFAAVRMDKKHEKVVASGTNASYYEIASSGSEFYSGNLETEGSVDRGQGNPSSANAHTGQFSLLVGTGKKGFNYTLTSDKTDLSKKYRASVWVYAPGNSETQTELNKIELYYTVNEQEITAHPVLQKSKSKSWYLLNIDIEPSEATSVYIGVRNNSLRGVYFDDFRVHPLDASMTCYVYDQSTNELSHILDANNFYTRFEYDAMGRLIRTSKELLNFDFGPGKESLRIDAVKETKYNYGRGN